MGGEEPSKFDFFSRSEPSGGRIMFWCPQEPALGVSVGSPPPSEGSPGGLRGVLLGDHPVRSPLGEVLSYLDSPSLKVPSGKSDSRFLGFFMLSSTPPSLKVPSGRSDLRFWGFFMLS